MSATAEAQAWPPIESPRLSSSTGYFYNLLITMFSIHHVDGDARTGVLRLDADREISTPGVLVYTRRGGALNLTPDLLQTLKPDLQAVQLQVMQL